MAQRNVRSGPPSFVERPEMAVMFLEVADEPDAIARGWNELERRLGSLRGRRFLGTFHGGTYRVSVVQQAEDDPAALDLRTGTVSGGTYLRVRLRGEPEAIYDHIPTAFAELERTADRDAGRDPIESYRRLDEVDILLPVTNRERV
jgi:hypothetical protein